MDNQSNNGQSPAAGGSQEHHINQGHSPSPSSFAPNDPSAGLDLTLDQQQQQFAATGDTSFDSSFADSFLSSQSQSQQQASQSFDAGAFDPSASFSQQGPGSMSFASQPQQTFLSPNINDGDFSLFPSGTQGDQFNTPLFDTSGLSPQDLNSNNMASPQSHHSPSQSGSAHQSPSFSHHLSSPQGPHSRNVSLGPEAALLPGQMSEWNAPQFQTHRRSPSEYSEVSSVSPSPNMIAHDSFDDAGGHSPLQRASDGSMYQDVLNMGNFTIADQAASPGLHARSPSHSPAISPRIGPQHLPDVNQQMFLNAGYGGLSNYPTIQGPSDGFAGANQDMGQMAAPSINIDYAPTNAKQGGFGGNKPQMDQDSLAPPDRGRPKSRPRSVTDPFQQPGTVAMNRESNASLGSNLSPNQNTSRSLSPLDRQPVTAAGRRRLSTSAVPTNAIALRLADPEYQNSQESGTSKRVQKHPATFQCTLCPKRFTRAYNLRSHLRTHTDERPFVCTVCGKAFARQHDRKRHESLHSGEKKFVCKGDLKAGGQWGCGRRFARADALGRHFRSEAGRVCIKPLLDEEMVERQRAWQEQRMQQDMAQNMSQGMSVEAPSYPMDASGNYALPAALLAQYPALAQMNWNAPEMSGMEDDLSGRSSFDASDYDEGDDGGYVSGPGTGYGDGGMGQNFGEMGYNSDIGAGR